MSHIDRLVSIKNVLPLFSPFLDLEAITILFYLNFKCNTSIFLIEIYRVIVESKP